MSKSERPNILVICGRNKRRSRTAEHLFKNDARFNIRSAGLSPKSDRKISETDLNWANLVLVMEKNQRSKIKELYPHKTIQTLEILDIPDDYEFMDTELVEMLNEKINYILETKYQL
jgi:protein-tyrosine phosphatase